MRIIAHDPPHWSKYPPAKPGALEMGPLKAARIDMKFRTSTLAPLMPHLSPTRELLKGNGR